MKKVTGNIHHLKHRYVIVVVAVMSIGFDGSRFPKSRAEVEVSNLQYPLETTVAVTETVLVSEAWQRFERIKTEIAMMNNFFN